MGVMFPLFQSVEPSPGCHNYSSEIFIHPFPWYSQLWLIRYLDLCTFPDMVSDLTLFLQQVVLHSHKHCLCLLWLGWSGWSTCQWKTRPKKIFEYFSLFQIPGNLVSCFLPEKAHIFHNFPFITNIPIEDFVLVLWDALSDLVLSWILIS